MAFCILSSINSKNLKYSLPLTDEDRSRAEELRSLLILDVKKPDVDQTLENEDAHDTGEVNEEEIFIEASGDISDNMDDQGSDIRDQEDDDLADFVDEGGLDDDIEGEDFILPIQMTEDEDTCSTPANHTPSYIGKKIDVDGGRVDAFHKFIRLFLYPREDGNIGDTNYEKWNHPIEYLLALRHLKPGGGFKDAQDTTGTFAIMH